MIVVFDTNIWISELGLQSPSGSVARFFVRRYGAKVGLPEVVKLEVERNLYDHLKGFADDIRNKHRQLLTVFGRLKTVVLPTESEIEERIQQLFTGFGDALVEIPFSLESARSSLLKEISKVPPSDKSQQFKDGVLWADCLALTKTEEVVLVTSDKAFYKERDYAKGLAEPLLAEASSSKNRLKIVNALSNLLDDLRTDVGVTDAELVRAVLAQERETLERVLARNGFDLGMVQRVDRSFYITEIPDQLFIEFQLTFTCPATESPDREPGTLTLPGDGIYILSKKRFTELRNQGEALLFRLPDGTEKQVRSVRLYVDSAVIGHREISHTVRYRVSDEETAFSNGT